MQTPLRALVHFLTVGWKKHMPGVKKHTSLICCVQACFNFLIYDENQLYVSGNSRYNILHSPLHVSVLIIHQNLFPHIYPVFLPCFIFFTLVSYLKCLQVVMFFL